MDRQVLLGLNHFKNKNGIIVFESPTVNRANDVATEILEKYCDFKTAIFLSGGNTPKKLYELTAKNRNLKAGAVGQIDERFGKKGYRHSNEAMIEGTGLIKYFESKNIRFYPVLQNGELSIKDTATQYDEALRFIFKYIPKSVGILGIGADGHTAGIPSGNQKGNIKNQKLMDINKRIKNDQGSFVSYYEDESKIYGPRITMNYTGLSQLDLLLVMVLGSEKREALKNVFKYVHSTGSGLSREIEDCPARFYLRPEIARKTIMITDQAV
jgi:6-phosphogluconolactonase/glucosamine-6-phosphate isomerase/deaminase